MQSSEYTGRTVANRPSRAFLETNARSASSNGSGYKCMQMMSPLASPAHSRLEGTRMLVVTNSRVWSPGDGRHFRFTRLASELCRHGIQLDLVTSTILLPDDLERLRSAGITAITTGEAMGKSSRKPELRSKIRSWCPGAVVGAFRAARYLGRQLGSAFATRTARERKLSELQSPLLSLLVADYVRAKCPDFVLVEYLVHSYALEPLKRQPPTIRPITLVDTHDVAHQRCESFAAHGNPLPHSLSREEEQEMLGAFDIIIAIQDEDTKTFEAMNPGSTVVTCLPPCTADPVKPSPDRRPKSAAFFGGKGYSGPNESGLAQFLAHAWPLIKQAHPTATLKVYGDTRDAFVSRSFPGVSFEGYVADLREAYAQTEIVISPMTSGGGLKTKVLEALASGRPVVATTHSAIGFPNAEGHGLLVAGDWHAFAITIIDLFASRDRLPALGRSAADYVAREFNETRVMQDLLSAMQAHLERRKA